MPDIDEVDHYYGKDCPVGMVQVESVLCHRTEMRSSYGWKPSIDAMIDIYVDGKRFNIYVGTFQDGSGGRGLYIISDGHEVIVEKRAINSAAITLKEHALHRD